MIIHRQELDKSEIEFVSYFANKVNQNASGNTDNPDTERGNIIGFIGEYAVAKFFGFHWSLSVINFTKNDFPSLPHNIDVKTTSGRNNRKCIVPTYPEWTEYVKDDFIFIFCNYYDSGVDIWGPIWASEYFSDGFAERLKNRDDRQPAWTMDRSKLPKWQKNPVRNFLQTGSG